MTVQNRQAESLSFILPALEQVEANMAKPKTKDQQILELLKRIIRMLEEIQLSLDIPGR